MIHFRGFTLIMILAGALAAAEQKPADKKPADKTAADKKDADKNAAGGAADDTKPTLPEKKGDVLGEVVAVVGSIPITNLDLESEMESFKRRKNIKKDKRKPEFQVLDLLISRAIVDFIASEESITVSPERIKTAVDKEMKRMGISREEVFETKLQREMGISFSEYKEELARQLKTQQVVQLRVSVPNPNPSQVEEWYKLNQKMIGDKYLVRMVFKNFKKGDTADELRVSKIMNQARAQAARNFAEAAKNFSDHYSKKNGGLVGWMRLDEIARIDPFLAGAVQNTKPGRLSQNFVGENGYYFALVESTKPVPLDEVYEYVRSILYAQNEQAAFADWINQQRKKVSVTVYLPDYQE